ncbi:PssE/Cps14G family polysaccharide biosynthesis glycosyltransferase [Pseudoalteromonas aliena]|uniref:PssE/Cps14G family polysaccharide biosynthesis glycosyltransferase n=1 Tax=Pseudoalteromonas aliena TaxID=247523 RepID=UPI00311E4960
MNIFVTVGSTRYDSLFYAVEKALNDNHNATFQIADGEYSHAKITTIRFVKNINEYYQTADVIITHAGAGSVYNLLEMGKKIIVVQNTERVDAHQQDLVKFVEEKNYGLGCYDVSQIAEKINQIEGFQPVPYIKKEFSKTKEICESLQL